MSTVLALNGLTVDVRADGESSGGKYLKSLTVTLTKDVAPLKKPKATGPNGSYTADDIENWIKGYDPDATVTPNEEDVPAGKKAVPGESMTITPEPGGALGNKFSASEEYTVDGINVLVDE